MKAWAILFALAAVAGLAGVAYGLHKSALRKAEEAGYRTASIQCLQAIDKAIEDASKARSKIEYRNAKLSDPDIDAILFTKWVRRDD